jgi:hypothetical protein
MFIPGKPFQSSLMFVGKAGAYPRVKHQLALHAYIRLGCKGSSLLLKFVNYGRKFFYRIGLLSQKVLKNILRSFLSQGRIR